MEDQTQGAGEDPGHGIGAKAPLDAGLARIWQDNLGEFHVEAEGAEFHPVRPHRVFPLSSKADYVSFVNDKAKEVLLIGNLANLDEESRKALTVGLDRMYYVPQITRVFKISETMGMSHWTVKTDRGYATFDIVTREHIREISPGRFVMVDADGSRFEIPDITRMDGESQALIATET